MKRPSLSFNLFAGVAALTVFTLLGCSQKAPSAEPIEEIASVSAKWGMGCAPWDGASMEIEWTDVFNVKHKLALYDRLKPPFPGIRRYVLGAPRPQSGQFLTQYIGVYEVVSPAIAEVSSEKGAGLISGSVVSGDRKWTFEASPSGDGPLPCG